VKRNVVIEVRGLSSIGKQLKDFLEKRPQYDAKKIDGNIWEVFLKRGYNILNVSIMAIDLFTHGFHVFWLESDETQSTQKETK
jgi:hypothetical protein